MNPLTSNPPSIRRALRCSASAVLQACRETRGSVRAAVSAVRAAAAEDRGVVRSICAATEQTARAGIRTTRTLEEQSLAAWRPLPIVGRAVGGCIKATTWISVGLLSLVVIAMIVCDVLLNTARTERVG